MFFRLIYWHLCGFKLFTGDRFKKTKIYLHFPFDWNEDDTVYEVYRDLKEVGTDLFILLPYFKYVDLSGREFSYVISGFWIYMLLPVFILKALFSGKIIDGPSLRYRGFVLFWRWYLKRFTQLKEIHLINSYSKLQSALILVSIEKDLAIVEYQHGHIYPSHPGYQKSVSNFLNYSKSELVVYSYLYVHYLKSMPNFSEINVVYKKYNLNLFHAEVSGVRCRYVFILQDKPTSLKLLSEFSSILSINGYNVGLKFHPRHRFDIPEDLLMVERVEEIKDLRTCLSKEVIFVGVYSTVLVDLFLNGYRVLLSAEDKRSRELIDFFMFSAMDGLEIEKLDNYLIYSYNG